MLHLTLYTKDPCPLCDDLKAMLNELQLTYPHELNETDITRSADLNAFYRYIIPVLENRDTGQSIKAPIDLPTLIQFLQPPTSTG